MLTIEEGLRAQGARRRARACASAPRPTPSSAARTSCARKLIDDGALGTITAGTAYVMSHGMENWHPNPDFFFLPGAGPVLDVGPYYVADLINLIGPVKRVAALTNTATPTRTVGAEGPRKGQEIPVKTPTNVHALLEFDSGAAVTLGASWDVWAHRHRNIELYGTDGALFVPDPNWFGGTVELVGPRRQGRRGHAVGPPLRGAERHPPERQLRQLPHRRPRRHGASPSSKAARRAARSTGRCTAST